MTDLFVGIGDIFVDGLAEVIRELPRPPQRLDVLLRLVQDRMERHEVAGVYLLVERISSVNSFSQIMPCNFSVHIGMHTSYCWKGTRSSSNNPPTFAKLPPSSYSSNGKSMNRTASLKKLSNSLLK